MPLDDRQKENLEDDLRRASEPLRLAVTAAAEAMSDMGMEERLEFFDLIGGVYCRSCGYEARQNYRRCKLCDRGGVCRHECCESRC